MKTLKELKDFCKKNNVKFEINPRYSDKEYYSCVEHKWMRVQIGWWFGMNNISGTKHGMWQWVWYTNLDDQLDDASRFWFDQRHSMAVGQTYKSPSEMMRAETTIERRS